ncbi:MAG: hypothetical protein ACK41Q_03545 [Candidatus Brocadia sp.]
MGGLYGKLLITAFIVFCAILLGFILMCIVLRRRNGVSCEKNQIKPFKPKTHDGILTG